MDVHPTKNVSIGIDPYHPIPILTDKWVYNAWTLPGFGQKKTQKWAFFRNAKLESEQQKLERPDLPQKMVDLLFTNGGFTPMYC